MTQLDAPALDAAVAGEARRHRSVDTVLVRVLLVVAVTVVVAYVFVALRRMAYPYELQWMEGGSVGVADRLAHGRSIYTAPSLRFTPWPYPPLYFAVSAAVARVVGDGFVALRLVSFGASLGVLVLLARLAWAETKDGVAALLAVGINAATFRAAGAWADIGRVDSLWLLACVAAIVAARRAVRVRDGIAVGALLAVATLVKQDALVVAAPLVVWLVLVRRPVGRAAALTLAGGVLAATAMLHATSDGWSTFYVWRELTGHALVRSAFVGYWTDDVVRPLPVVTVLAVVGAVAAMRRGWRSATGATLAGVGGLVAAGWVGRLHSGGYVNNLMPTFASAAVLAAIGFHALRTRMARRDEREWVVAVVAFALAVQLAVATIEFRDTVPIRADRVAGDRLITRLRSLPGHVVVLIHPWYAHLAGKGDFAAGVAIHDLLRGPPGHARTLLTNDLGTALLAPDIGAVVLDQPPDPQLAPTRAAAYDLQPDPAVAGDAFYPVTDLRLRPLYVYVRRGSASVHVSSR